MNKNRRPTRTWWLELFVDHPGAKAGDSQAFVRSETGATSVSKVYCHACFLADIQHFVNEDVHAVTEGRISAMRDKGEIETNRKSIIWY
jgi:hypothetical protein